MSKKRKNEPLVLTVDVLNALAKFPFIENENITLLDRTEKDYLYSLCDSLDGAKVQCFWDRHLVADEIFRCPIRKVYKGKQQTYHSNINGNTYTITDTLNTTEWYYETDGYFCSPECCMAFLDDEELRNPLYSQSKQLIIAALGVEPRRAHHWRTLAVCGGTLSIQEFRKSMANRQYTLERVFPSFPYCYKFKETYHL